MLMRAQQGKKQAGQPGLVRAFDVLAKAPAGVARLRELILTLAVQGRLVAQDVRDEPASVLLQQISAERARLIAERRIKKDQSLPGVSAEEVSSDLPESWARARLGSLGRIVGGGTPKSDMPEYWAENGIAWLTPADLYNRREMFISRGRRDISPEGLAASSSQLMPAGTVLFSSRAPIGYVAVAASPLATNQGFKSCVPYAQGMSEYLYWHLKYLAPEIDAGASGTTFKEISGKDFAEVVVSLPPLAEQGRIVARVEELMRLCDELEAKGMLCAAQHSQLVNTLLRTLTDSRNADELAANWQRVAAHFDLLLDRPEAVDALEQTILQLAVRGLLVPQDPKDEPASVLLTNIRDEKDRLIAERKIKRDKPLVSIAEEEQPFGLPRGWAWVRLGSLGESFDYGSSQKAGEDSSAVPILRMGNVQGGKVLMRNLKFLVDQEAELPALLLRRGDLLFNRTNSFELVGKTALFEGHSRDVTFASYLIRIRLMAGLCSPEYINIYMNTRDCRTNEIEPDLTQQTGQANYNGTKLKSIRVPLPPLAEQFRIVTRVTEIRQLCADLRQKLVAGRRSQEGLAEALVNEA
ncbi:restriction endonuclease subunit S [Roseateles microcysteis]|uniref:restriction endonuclease subunit S n=1 Tax=Roseateles microcysteis TaxID=3119057 RepID=UPI002FE56576